MFKPGKTVTVFVPKKYLIEASEEIQGSRKVWGTDVYTDASDIIAVCQHVGKLNLHEVTKHQDILNGVLVSVKILGPQK
jgi:hypothetical protein